MYLPLRIYDDYLFKIISHTRRFYKIVSILLGKEENDIKMSIEGTAGEWNSLGKLLDQLFTFNLNLIYTVRNWTTVFQ